MRRVEICWWGKELWRRLSRVVKYTANQQCNGWAVNVEEIKPDVRTAPSGSIGQATNTAKLEWWNARVQSFQEGDEVLLVDSDAMILRPLDDVWDREFDVAYTAKLTASRYPINGGVIFLRVNARSKAFMQAWTDQNEHFFTHQSDHQPWWQRYAGMNQAALGCMITGPSRIEEIRSIEEAMSKVPISGTGSFKVVPRSLHPMRERRALLMKPLTHPDPDSPAARLASIAVLPCSEWNCEDTYWHRMRQLKPRIVHVKSRLRQESTSGGSPTYDIQDVAMLWRKFEADARKHEREATA